MRRRRGWEGCRRAREAAGRGGWRFSPATPKSIVRMYPLAAD